MPLRELGRQLAEVRRALEVMVDVRLMADFGRQEHEAYGRLLAREELLLFELRRRTCTRAAEPEQTASSERSAPI